MLDSDTAPRVISSNSLEVVLFNWMKHLLVSSASAAVMKGLFHLQQFVAPVHSD